MLYNLPEGVEGENKLDVSDFVKYFILNTLNLTGTFEIERPPMKRNLYSSFKHPRPIHINFLRHTDRNKVLNSGKNLKGKLIKGSKIWISDDVHPQTRNEQASLMQKVKKLRNEGKFAFIPFSVPRVIKFKESDAVDEPLKTLSMQI